jgi:hypothetical protein
VDEKIFRSKTDELKIDLERVLEELGKEAKLHAEFADMATAIFDLTQRAGETWLRSSTSVRRELLDVFCSNRSLDGASLYMDWRKPFDALAKQPDFKGGVIEGTRTPDLLSHRRKRAILQSIYTTAFTTIRAFCVAVV